VWSRQGSNAAGDHCTTRRRNAHRIEDREVLYRWHPWFGRVVRVDGVIEKDGGDVFRCCAGGELSSRSLELPAWMFDRATCTLTRSTRAPAADLAALSALRRLLNDLGRRPADVAAISNAPVSGAASCVTPSSGFRWRATTARSRAWRSTQP
jgi:hypothetical protein